MGLEHPTFCLRGGDVTTSPPLPIFFESLFVKFCTVDNFLNTGRLLK